VKKLIAYLLIGTTLTLALLTPAFVGQQASAIDVFERSCEAGGGGSGGGDADAEGGTGSPLCDAADDDGDSVPNLVKNVINLMLVALGFVAVIMIIIGGIRYTTSNGDSNQTKAAKDTIMYAVIGLVVAIMAFAIVNFVLDFFTQSGAA
jgi:hypothetical protein